jgi:hypothetical protein
MEEDSKDREDAPPKDHDHLSPVEDFGVAT